MSSKREKDRPGVTPEQLKKHSQMFRNQPMNLGNGQKMVCIRGDWRLNGPDMPPPVRLDVLFARQRDRKWRAENE